jgi:hydroxylysine kinase
MSQTEQLSGGLTSVIPDAVGQLTGLAVTRVRPLGGELNRTYQVATSDATRLVVKVVPATEADIAGVRWQHQLLDVCADHDDLPTPPVMRDPAGSDIVVDDRADESWAVSVYGWMPGEILGRVPVHSVDLLTDWGRIAGRFAQVFSSLTPDDRLRTHEWDLLKAPDRIGGYFAAVEDAVERGYIDTALQWFSDIVSTRIDDLPCSVVHHDLNDYNVLAPVDPAEQQRISGVIDFTDALYTVRVSEVAIAAAYAMLRKHDPIAALAAVVDGFHRTVPLDDRELAVLYPLAVLRLALNGATWKARRHGLSATYARQRSEHTWAALALLTEHEPAEVDARLREHLERPQEEEM